MQLMVIVPCTYGGQQERLQRACNKYAPCTQPRAAARMYLGRQLRLQLRHLCGILALHLGQLSGVFALSL